MRVGKKKILRTVSCGVERLLCHLSPQSRSGICAAEQEACSIRGSRDRIAEPASAPVRVTWGGPFLIRRLFFPLALLTGQVQQQGEIGWLRSTKRFQSLNS